MKKENLKSKMINSIFLVIDTATVPAQVRLGQNNKIIGSQAVPAERPMGQKLIRAIHELLEEQAITLSDVGRIAVQSGPGESSSVLRSGVVVASVMSMANGAELVSINSKGEEETIKQAINNPVVATVMTKYQGPGYG